MKYAEMKTKYPSLEEILQIALAEQLPKLIEGKHPRYPTVDKQEMLKLCDVLRKACYLDVAIQYGMDGFPVPGYGDYVNVTIQGRDYLERIKQNRLWRRLLGWFIAFAAGVATPLIVDWSNLLLKLLAKNYGLEP